MRLGIDARNVVDKNSGLVGYVRNLIFNLVKYEDLKITIFCQEQYRYIFKEIANSENIEIVTAFYSPKFLDVKNLYYEKYYFAKQVDTANLDLFHNPFGFGIPGGIKTRSILTVHDLIPLTGSDDMTRMQLFVYKKSLSTSLRKAEQIITISDFTKQELLKSFPSLKGKKVRTIYNGFDKLNSFKNLDEKQLALSQEFKINGSKYICYTGSATKRKNLPKLVESFAKFIRESKLDYKLFVISKFNRPLTRKTYFEILDIGRKHDISKNLILPDRYIDDNEKAALIYGSEFFVYPSVYEGFGLPILEAMSLGKAVACSDIGIFKEICGDSVVFFDPNKITSISESFLQLSDSTQRKVFEKRGLARQENFSWDKMTTEYHNIYNEMIVGMNSETQTRSE